MDRSIAIFNDKKYTADYSVKEGEINKISLYSNKKENGFKFIRSAFNKKIYKREVKKEDVSEFYREYFIIEYKKYEFFVMRGFKDSNEIEIITTNSSIGKECGFDQQDRDCFIKKLGDDVDFILKYVKQDYFKKITTKKEVTREAFFCYLNKEID